MHGKTFGIENLFIYWTNFSGELVGGRDRRPGIVTLHGCFHQMLCGAHAQYESEQSARVEYLWHFASSKDTHSEAESGTFGTRSKLAACDELIQLCYPTSFCYFIRSLCSSLAVFSTSQIHAKRWGKKFWEINFTGFLKRWPISIALLGERFHFRLCDSLLKAKLFRDELQNDYFWVMSWW